MRFTLPTSIVALAVLAAAVPDPVKQGIGIPIPIAKRSILVNADKTVDFEALNSHAEFVRAKILRGFDNFERNTGSPHPAALKGNQKRGSGGVELTSYENQLWYGNISVGTPGSTFTVDFDTGSSDLLLPGPKCNDNCEGHAIFDPSTSSTSQDTGKNYTLKYGGGSGVDVEGYTDTVTIAGLTATKQTLGVATSYSSSLAVANGFPADGLFGVGFQSISFYNAQPVFQTLISQGQVDEPAFSFKLASTGSELYVGGANSALYTGDFTYTPVTIQGHWQVNMDNIKGNEQTILTNIASIIDTGTTLIIGHPSQVAGFYNVVHGTPVSGWPGYYSFPCDSFPSVSLTFGGVSFPISTAALNLGPVPSDPKICVSGIIGQDTGASFWVVGDILLEGLYTKFDVGKSQVGFAQLA